MDYIISLFTNIWSVFLVILFFGGSIFIHELGHFLAARRRGLKVERFSIGFGPKLFGWERNSVEYRISLLPLGGYVALPQLANMGAIEGKTQTPKEQLPPISYADKIIVSVMGAVFNLIFAFLLATLLWQVGQPTTEEQQTTTIGFVPKVIQLDLDTEADSPAYKAGLKPGDKILSIDGVTVEAWGDVQKILVTGTGRAEDNAPKAIFEIERNGELMTIPVYPELMQVNPLSGDQMRVSGISPSRTLLVGNVLENSPAAEAGIKKGDIITHANGQILYSLPVLTEILNESPNVTTQLTVQRGNQTLMLSIQPKLAPFTRPLGKLNIHSQSKPTPFIELLPIESLKESTNSLVVFQIDTAADDSLSSIQEGDVLESINGTPVKSLTEFQKLAPNMEQTIQQVLTFKNTDTGVYTVNITNPVSLEIQPSQKQAVIGIELQRKSFLVYINPFNQFKDSVLITLRTLGGLINPQSDLKLSNLMGPPGIIRVFHTFSTEDLRLVIWFTVFVNINLAILNLLPIPVLDGGHMLYATIGRLRNKPLPARFIITTQATFMFLLFSLILYVSFFDVRRWQGDNEIERRIMRQQALYLPISFENNKS